MDPFLRQQAVWTAPVESAVAITPSNTVAIAPPNGDPLKATRGVLFGGAGTATVVMADGSVVLLTIPATACGSIMPIAITRVNATGTTCTAMVAFY